MLVDLLSMLPILFVDGTGYTHQLFFLFKKRILYFLHGGAHVNGITKNNEKFNQFLYLFYTLWASEHIFPFIFWENCKENFIIYCVWGSINIIRVDWMRGVVGQNQTHYKTYGSSPKAQFFYKS